MTLWWRGELDSVPVPHGTGWIAIGDRVHVPLDPGASLRLARKPLWNHPGARHAILDGEERFRVAVFRANAP